MPRVRYISQLSGGEQKMRKVILALLLVAVLLSLFASIALAADLEDPAIPHGLVDNPHSAQNNMCIHVPVQAGNHGNFSPCP